MLNFCCLNTLSFFLTFYKELSEFVLRQTLSLFVVCLAWLNILSACLYYVTVCLSGRGLNLDCWLLRFYLYLPGNFLDQAPIGRISMMTALRRSTVTSKQRILLVGGGRFGFCFLVPKENRVLHSRIYSSLRPRISRVSWIVVSVTPSRYRNTGSTASVIYNNAPLVVNNLLNKLRARIGALNRDARRVDTKLLLRLISIGAVKVTRWSLTRVYLCTVRSLDLAAVRRMPWMLYRCGSRTSSHFDLNL